jgi:two-component system, NtrC family, response regulator AtoC
MLQMVSFFMGPDPVNESRASARVKKTLRSREGLLFGAAVGTGLTARAAEEGGADFVLALNAGMLRVAGAPSLSCMLPIGESNEIVTRVGRNEILGRVTVPVFFGLCVMDPRLDLNLMLANVQRWGFDGVVNFPTVTSIEGEFRSELDSLGVGFQREVAMIEAARKIGLATLVYVASPEEASAMQDAGADLFCVSLGFTSGNKTGLPDRMNLTQATEQIRRVLKPLRRKETLALVEGGPIIEPAEAFHICEACSLDGYIGGSTIDRLPLQAAVRATAATYKSLAKLKRNIETLKEGLLGQGWRWGIIGRAPVMAKIVNQIEKVAPTRLPVLILGENGTGKELVANALHLSSGRQREKMMVVNCAAIPRELLESELFGYEAGAFTGATRMRIGRFEEARGSTLFLDEVGDLEPALQAKLLRVVGSGRFERLGSNTSQVTDARIVCATNRDLRKMVQEGSFREDLYYRLSTIEIYIPPLRNRIQDLPLLVQHFFERVRADLNPALDAVDGSAMRLMVNYEWPGNVRELRHALERAAVLCAGTVIGADDFEFLRRPSPQDGLTPPDNSPPATTPKTLSEREWILNALVQHRYRRSETAAALGLSRKTLYNKMLLFWGQPLTYDIVCREDAA